MDRPLREMRRSMVHYRRIRRTIVQRAGFIQGK